MLTSPPSQSPGIYSTLTTAKYAGDLNATYVGSKRTSGFELDRLDIRHHLYIDTAYGIGLFPSIIHLLPLFILRTVYFKILGIPLAYPDASIESGRTHLHLVPPYPA